MSSRIGAPGPWTKEALCVGKVELFFSDEHILETRAGTPARRDAEVEVARAKAICARCPVYKDCELYSMRWPYDTSGIYAGRTAAERRKVARQATATRRHFGGCPVCLVKTPTITCGPGRLECLECGTRWPPL